MNFTIYAYIIIYTCDEFIELAELCDSVFEASLFCE